MNQSMTRNRLIARYRYFYDYVFKILVIQLHPAVFAGKKHIPFVWNMRNHHNIIIVRLGRFGVLPFWADGTHVHTHTHT